MSSLRAVLVGLSISSAAVAYAQDEPKSEATLSPPIGDAAPTEQVATTAEAGVNAAQPDSAAPNGPATEAAAPKEKKSGSRLIEEIIVTAQKREENLMAVPISIQAFSPESLEAAGVSDQMGLSKVVPGMDVGSQAGFSTVYIRGVGTDAWLTADPSVAAYVDGVYYSFTPSVIQEFGAVERVEVLKGPQGTLFGRNAVGGAINVITKDPDFLEEKLEVQAGLSNFNSYKVRAYSNMPLMDNLAVNFSALYKKGDSYLKGSTTAGKPLFSEVTSGARVKVRWAPTDTTEAKLALVRTYTQSNGAMPLNRDPSPLGSAVGVPGAEGEYTSHVDERLYLRGDGTTFSGEIKQELPFMDVKVLASDQHHTQPYNYDFDASEKPIVSFDIPVHYADIQEGELQFLSNANSPGAEWLTATAGVFYYQNEQGFDPIRVTVANLDPRNLQANGVNLPQNLYDLLDSYYGPSSTLGGLLSNLGIPSAGVPFYTVTDTALIETKSISGYVQLTAALNEWAKLTLGGRYQREKRGVKESNTNVQALNGSDAMTIQAISWTQARDGEGNPHPLYDITKGFKPKIGLDLMPFGDDTLLYATYQEAVKAHAYNAYAIYLRPAYVKPEKTTAYEMGLKGSFFEGTTRFSIAAFYYEIKDLQTQFVSLINGGAVSFENAGTAYSKGIDFDSQIELFPSVLDGWAMTLNGAFINAKYDKYKSGSGYDENTKIFGSNHDYSGNRQVRSPKYTANAALTKTFSFDGGSLELGGNYYYNDGFFYTASNDPDYMQPSFSTVGAHVAYEFEPWKTRLSIFCDNLTDKYYTNGLLVTDFGPNYAVAPPRTYGFTVNVEF